MILIQKIRRGILLKGRLLDINGVGPPVRGDIFLLVGVGRMEVRVSDLRAGPGILMEVVMMLRDG